MLRWETSQQHIHLKSCRAVNMPMIGLGQHLYVRPKPRFSAINNGEVTIKSLTTQSGSDHSCDHNNIEEDDL